MAKKWCFQEKVKNRVVKIMRKSMGSKLETIFSFFFVASVLRKSSFRKSRKINYVILLIFFEETQTNNIRSIFFFRIF